MGAPIPRIPRNQKGFTVIEMMVVLSIIAILVSVAVASYNISLSEAKEVACRYNLRAVNDAIVLYRNTDNQGYPELLDDLAPNYIKDGATFECPVTKESYLYDADEGTVRCSIPEHNLGSD